MEFHENGIEPAVISLAIDETIDRNKTWLYAKKILDRCLEQKIFTVAEYEKSNEEYSKQRGESAQNQGDKRRSKNKFINFDGGKADYNEIRRQEKVYIKGIVADEDEDKPKRTPRKRSRFANFEGRKIDYDLLDRLEEEYIKGIVGEIDEKESAEVDS
ncbi:hypothetical protein AGMMS49975_14660 [Clostridia bacterium]|nr:hypothetical protein AGMMS49975_14660 [Clostridia bacterium]